MGVRAEEVLGARFDLREFHARVLESGCMPLKLRPQKIERWIARAAQPSKRSMTSVEFYCLR